MVYGWFVIVVFTRRVHLHVFDLVKVLFHSIYEQVGTYLQETEWSEAKKSENS